MATPTGYDWGAWNVLDAAMVLTEGGTENDTSAEIDLDVTAACEVSIDADYSNDAIAAGTGLYVYILRDIDGTAFEGIDDAPWGFMMPTVINVTRRRTFSVDPKMIGKFKVYLLWTNTTSGAVATIATAYRTATVPIAVA